MPYATLSPATIGLLEMCVVLVMISLVVCVGNDLPAGFAGVVDAVNCAAEIQQELAERNAQLPFNRRRRHGVKS